MRGTDAASPGNADTGEGAGAAADPYASFRGLSSAFHDAYHAWHASGQYEGSGEFASVADVRAHPPSRERDDWYAEELRVLDEHWRGLAGSRALEIGCGDGNLTGKLARRCGHLVAWDIDPAAVALTRMRLEELGLSDRVTLEVRAAGDAPAEASGAFDVVFFVQVLEHVPGWEQARLFDRVYDLVAPGGVLFVSTPNRWTLRDSHDTGRLFIHWLPRKLRVAIARRLGWGVPGHDPSWPYPPVLHDYVSFGWMQKRARRAVRGTRSSRMLFYPDSRTWLKARAGGRGPKQLLRRFFALLGRALPLNRYFGSKVVFAKPPGDGGGAGP